MGAGFVPVIFASGGEAFGALPASGAEIQNVYVPSGAGCMIDFVTTATTQALYWHLGGRGRALRSGRRACRRRRDECDRRELCPVT